VFVHWRTARALHARGLIGYPYKGGYEEGWSIALTAEGWAAIGRTPPSDLVLPSARCRGCGPKPRVGRHGGATP